MSEMSGKGRKAKRLVSAFLHVVTGAALLAMATVAAAGAATEDQGPGYQSGSLQLAFTDGSGNVLRAPQIDVDTAYPGMVPQGTVITLRNTGTIEESYRVSSRLHASGRHSLNEVLLVSVRDRATGRVTYRGSLSDLAFESATSLAPGQSASYAVRITWTETGENDNAYQGRSLSFGLRAHAESVAQ